MTFTVTVLGSAAAGFPGPGNAGSGFLVEDGSTRLLLDCGNGVLANLAQVGGAASLSGVALSHLHADHVSDLYPLSIFLRFGKRPPEAPKRLPLLGPPGTRTLLYRWFHLFARDPDPYVETFDIREYAPWDVHDVGDLRVQPCPVDHQEGKGHALRVASRLSPGRFCYSGDTRATALLTEAAHEADVFVCEATFPPGHPALAKQEHLSWEEAAMTAREARARRLVVTHLRIEDDPAEAVRIAASLFGGPVEHARPLAKFEIAPAASGATVAGGATPSDRDNKT